MKHNFAFPGFEGLGKVYGHLHKYNILPLSRCSCLTDALLDLNDMIRQTDADNICALVLLDFFKAFDKFNHVIGFNFGVCWILAVFSEPY